MGYDRNHSTGGMCEAQQFEVNCNKTNAFTPAGHLRFLLIDLQLHLVQWQKNTDYSFHVYSNLFFPPFSFLEASFS